MGAMHVNPGFSLGFGKIPPKESLKKDREVFNIGDMLMHNDHNDNEHELM